MRHPYPNLPQDGAIAYIREAAAEDLPDALPSQVQTQKVYAIHDADGRRLAIATTRDLAFAVVRRNDMVPVSVH